MKKKILLHLLFGGIFLLISVPSLAQQADLKKVVDHLKQNAQSLALAEADLTDLIVTAQYTTKHNGVTHVFLQQTYEGIPVHNAIINVSIDRRGQVLYVGNRAVPSLQQAIRSTARAVDPAQAVQVASRHLDIELTKVVTVERQISSREVIVSSGSETREDIPAKLVYLPLEEGGVRLAWHLTIDTPQHLWSTFVDAGTGAVLFTEDLLLEETWHITDGPEDQRFLWEVRQQQAVANMLLPVPAQQPGAPMHPTAPFVDGASYNVYAHPSESPSHTGDPEVDQRTLVVNPADATASPLGWHNTGSTQYTVTRGNNVHAYTDIDANNVADPGSDPSGGAGLVFDFPFDPLMEPETYRPAAVTNLFYWNNIIHDITYQYGFDEASGNFQVNNFGLGGLGNDDVRAEAQDGSGTNNANFGTPVDGFRPRMQMFRWGASVLVTVNTPAGIAGNYNASPAAFGPPLTPAGFTGDVELATDGAGLSPTDACEPLVGFTPGKIALLDRGNCTFVIKVKNAQNAGAVGVIVANNVSPGTNTMGGADPTILIPSAMISLNDGNLFKANLPVNATLKKNGADRDSDFDNGVIVHEYGHGISNRLTGGPGSVSCLNNQEQMGEGWSDFFALLLTDENTENRGIGTYVTFQPTTGPGIRTFPYNTSFGINPSTYDFVKVLAVPHGVGSVWTTMLWDMTRNLVDRYGYDSDVYNGTGGNNVAIQLVMDGLKIQPCNPGFVDGRDAILAADAASGSPNQCLIWDSFARRGLGFSADQGSSFSVLDGTEAYDLPESCCTFAILAGRVSALQANGTLNKGQANSLLKKLENAEKQINKGQAHAGINILNAFINEVNAMISSGKLTAAQGQTLINCALGVINRTQQAHPNARMADAEGQLQAQTLDLTAAGEIPTAFGIDQNYPNPFNPTTEIRFGLPEAAPVRLVVYDVMGRVVARLVDGNLPAGYHVVAFDGSHLASGMYLYRIEAGSFLQVKQMVLVK